MNPHSHAPESKDGAAPPEFMLRIVSLDYYMARPLKGIGLAYSNFLGAPIDSVPTIRIFGSTPNGQRACLHVHKVFPYFYVKWEQDLPSDPAALSALLRRFAAALESALQHNLTVTAAAANAGVATAAAAAPGPPFQAQGARGPGAAGGPAAPVQAGGVRPRAHVLSCTLVRARDFYGYHEGEEAFVKISLFNPRDVARAASLLQSGLVLGTRMQAFESHLPFLLQFKMDHNLYGMGHIRLSKGKFRPPLPPPSHHPAPPRNLASPPPSSADTGVQGSISASQRARVWNTDTVPPTWIWTALRSYDGSAVQPVPSRHSVCELELDCNPEGILNRTEFVRKPLLHEGFEGRGGVTHVESLLPMWHEEKARQGGREPPPPPPEPPRTPEPIGPHVDDVREYLRVVRDRQRERLAALGPSKAATPPAERRKTPERGPEPSPAVPTPTTPRIPPSLLALTQPANLLATTPYHDKDHGQDLPPPPEVEGPSPSEHLNPREAAAQLRAEGARAIPPAPRFDEPAEAGGTPPPAGGVVRATLPFSPGLLRAPDLPTQAQREMRDLIQWLEEHPEEWADEGEVGEEGGPEGDAGPFATPLSQAAPRTQQAGAGGEYEDLLLQLADLVESTPFQFRPLTQQPQRQPPPAVPSLAPLPPLSQRLPGSQFPGAGASTQREATFGRVQRAVARYLEQNQRELQDIMDCHEDAVIASQLEAAAEEGGPMDIDGPIDTFDTHAHDTRYLEDAGPSGPPPPQVFGAGQEYFSAALDGGGRVGEEGQLGDDDGFYRFLSSGEGALAQQEPLEEMEAGEGDGEAEGQPVLRLRGGAGSEDEEEVEVKILLEQEEEEGEEGIEEDEDHTPSRSQSQSRVSATPSSSQRGGGKGALPLVISPSQPTGSVQGRGRSYLITGPAVRSMVSGLRPVRRTLVPPPQPSAGPLPLSSAPPTTGISAALSARPPTESPARAPPVVPQSPLPPSPAPEAQRKLFSPPTVRASKQRRPPGPPADKLERDGKPGADLDAIEEDEEPGPGPSQRPGPSHAPAEPQGTSQQPSQLQSRIGIKVSQAALRARAILFNLDRTPTKSPIAAERGPGGSQMPPTEADPRCPSLFVPSRTPYGEDGGLKKPEEHKSPPPPSQQQRLASEGIAPTEVYVSQPRGTSAAAAEDVSGPRITSQPLRSGGPTSQQHEQHHQQPEARTAQPAASPGLRDLAVDGPSLAPGFPGFDSQRETLQRAAEASQPKPSTQRLVPPSQRSGSPLAPSRPTADPPSLPSADRARSGDQSTPRASFEHTSGRLPVASGSALRSRSPGSRRHSGGIQGAQGQMPPPSPRANREGLFVLRTRARPPEPLSAARSAWDEAGVPQAIPIEPFYGDIRDVPARPTVFAGRTFRVHDNDLSLCPEFQPSAEAILINSRSILGAAKERWEDQGGGELALQGWREWHEQRPALVRGLFAITPASRPPAPAAASQWLRQVQQGELQGLALPSQRREVDGFVMDPNTGALVPRGGADGEGAGGSQGSLLATPATQLTPAAHGPSAQLAVSTDRKKTKSPLPAGSQPSPADQPSKRVRASSPKYDERSYFYSGRGAVDLPDSPTGSQEGLLGNLRRPPSPKYDERSFFFSGRGAGEARPGPSPPGPRTLPADTSPGLGAPAVVPQATVPCVAPGDVGAQPTMLPRKPFESQVTPPSRLKDGEGTPSQQRGFKKEIAGKGQQMTVVSLELHCDNRGSLLPDPRYDSVRAIVVAELHDQEDVVNALYDNTIFVYEPHLFKLLPPCPETEQAAPVAALHGPRSEAAGAGAGRGAAQDLFAGDLSTQCEKRKWRGALPANTQAWVVATELDLFRCLIDRIRRLDPDVLVGFETQGASIGYLNDRFRQIQGQSAAAAAAATGQAVPPGQVPNQAGAYHKAREPPGLMKLLSRTPEGPSSIQEARGEEGDEYGRFHASGLHCTGRVVLNLWRILKSDLKLTMYSLQSCAAAVLRRRVPHFGPATMAAWWCQPGTHGKEKVLRHVSLLACVVLDMIEQLDLLGRTAEMARTFGIDFFSVLTRGSQYRVESMMVRLAHTQNYVLLTGSKEDVASQPAMECLPLVMEPESRMYTSPVIVLDFQSLYPSMVIAYNLCYSTMLGKTKHHDAELVEDPMQRGTRLGIRDTYCPPPMGFAREELGLDVDKLIITPNGTAFAPPESRPGILPRLLREILDTRVMVKGAMKRAPRDDLVTQRILNARQFGLKLIANVTYGYTAAGFSGRMPMAELADAIVQSGRETLERAIRTVEGNPTWGARVVYGDTDSLFVLCEGKTREEAFRIGNEIARAVTAANPPPVLLKMEKVYQPCFLITKKRYVGFKYEDPQQAQPEFDAKGIETVRRDTCPAVAKCMERALRIAFATKDLSQVKTYLTRQWTKILSNRINVQDFIFAKEVRLGTYSPKAAVAPPAAIVAAKQMTIDPRAEPKFGERVPYVVVYGEPGARLVDLVVPPQALVESQGQLRLHGMYYITKQIIPALERVFSLIGADLRAWMNDMPKPQRMMPQKRSLAALPVDQELPLAQGGVQTVWGPAAANRGLGLGLRQRGTIDHYYLSRHCAVCDGLTSSSRPLCNECIAQPDKAVATLALRVARLERQHARLVRICAACGGGGASDAALNHAAQALVATGGVACDSLDCGVYFERRKLGQELAAATALLNAGVKSVAVV